MWHHVNWNIEEFFNVVFHFWLLDSLFIDPQDNCRAGVYHATLFFLGERGTVFLNEPYSSGKSK